MPQAGVKADATATAEGAHRKQDHTEEGFVSCTGHARPRDMPLEFGKLACCATWTWLRGVGRQAD